MATGRTDLRLLHAPDIGGELYHAFGSKVEELEDINAMAVFACLTLHSLEQTIGDARTTFYPLASVTAQPLGDQVK